MLAEDRVNDLFDLYGDLAYFSIIVISLRQDVGIDLLVIPVAIHFDVGIERTPAEEFLDLHQEGQQVLYPAHGLAHVGGDGRYRD